MLDSDDPIVSSDIVGDPHSSIFDVPYTKALGACRPSALATAAQAEGGGCWIAAGSPTMSVEGVEEPTPWGSILLLSVRGCPAAP